METIQLKHTQLFYEKDFLSPVESDQLLRYFLKKEPDYWNQQKVTIFGKTYNSPRLERFISKEKDKTYSYSNNLLSTFPWERQLDPIALKLKQMGYDFNAVLINYYRNGQDSNGWHADNEKELGNDPIIASISLGAQRRFYFQSRDRSEKVKMNLEHGSLLIMEKGSQIHYQHQLPKMLKLAEPRINLTFRQIY